MADADRELRPGGLDHETSRSIAALLRRAVREDGITILLTSDDPFLLEIADEVPRAA
jgi:predicted ABC-type transport system involved in lysophospholipase L1 biosynthesis ATPase subunit